MQARSPFQQSLANSLAMLHKGFDATATWVTKLSWWKFFLFAALSLIAASIVQEELFSGSGGATSMHSEKKP
ncbi:sensor histidine kinase, partial [Massilia cavernae]